MNVLKRYLHRGAAAVLILAAACAGRQTQDSLPLRLNVVAPIYPAEAKAHRIQADVTLAVTVSSDGRTSEVAVVKSEGPEFDRAAIDAARAMTWEPARKSGVAVPYRLQFVLRFRLENNL
jgi:TonB family protein